MNILRSRIRRQRIRKDRVRASITKSKTRGQLLNLDVSPPIRSITSWSIGDHFDLQIVHQADRLRFIVKPSIINGYRLSSTTNRRARLVFPIKLKFNTSGAISKMETKIFGNELFLDIAKKMLSFNEVVSTYPTLFQWAQNEGSTANEQF